MSTEIVSGRVDADVKRRADAYIKKEGLTPGEVIRIVWNTIATTGQVPQESEGEGDRQKEALLDLVALRGSLRKREELASLSDIDIRKMSALGGDVL